MPLLFLFVLGCGAPQRTLPPPVALPAGESVRVVLLGDTGTVGSARRSECDPNDTSLRISPACRDAMLASIGGEHADLVILLGDLVYEAGPLCPDGLGDAQREELERLIGTVQTAAQAPVVMALGNHDVHQSVWGKASAERCYLDYAAEREDVYFPERNYFVDVGPLSICVLDSNRPLSLPVKLELRSGTRYREGRWQILAAHHVWKTYYDKQGQQKGPRLARALGMLPDMWINGHAHFQQFGVYNGVPALTTGAAGKLRLRPGCKGDECRKRGLEFASSRYGYAVLDVDPEEIHVAFKDPLGAAVFQWTRDRQGNRDAQRRRQDFIDDHANRRSRSGSP